MNGTDFCLFKLASARLMPCEECRRRVRSEFLFGRFLSSSRLSPHALTRNLIGRCNPTQICRVRFWKLPNNRQNQRCERHFAVVFQHTGYSTAKRIRLLMMPLRCQRPCHPIIAMPMRLKDTCMETGPLTAPNHCRCQSRFPSCDVGRTLTPA